MNRGTKQYRAALILLLIMVGFCSYPSQPALANGDEVGEYWEGYEERENEYAEATGEIAFYLGLLLNLVFVAVC